MDSASSVQFIAPMVALAAALITASISFVNLTLNKEQKISDFRQKWIDNLREDIADFLSCSRAMCRAFEAHRQSNAKPSDIEKFQFSPEKIGELRHNAATTIYRIKLRLNLAETEHQELVRLIDQSIDVTNRINKEKGTDYEEAFNAIERIADFAPTILKSEWRRVKKGELPFRITRNWVAPVVLLAALILFTLIWKEMNSIHIVDTMKGASAPIVHH